MTPTDKQLIKERFFASEVQTDGSRKFAHPLYATAKISEVGSLRVSRFIAYDIDRQFKATRIAYNVQQQVRLAYEIPPKAKYAQYGSCWMCYHLDWTAAVYHELELSSVIEVELPPNNLVKWLGN